MRAAIRVESSNNTSLVPTWSNIGGAEVLDQRRAPAAVWSALRDRVGVSVG